MMFIRFTLAEFSSNFWMWRYLAICIPVGDHQRVTLCRQKFFQMINNFR